MGAAGSGASASGNRGSGAKPEAPQLDAARAARAEGYGVEMAHDGDSALAKLRECSPDLVTLDILLPKRDGFEVLEAIRKQEGPRGQVPVVLLSGCTITQTFRQGRRMTRSIASSTGRPSPLPELTIQYADYADWQRQWLRGSALDEHLGYWRHQRAGLRQLQHAGEAPVIGRQLHVPAPLRQRRHRTAITSGCIQLQLDLLVTTCLGGVQDRQRHRCR